MEVTRLSADGAPVVVLHRVSADGQDAVLILANTDPDRSQAAAFSGLARVSLSGWVDLLDQSPPRLRADAAGQWTADLARRSGALPGARGDAPRHVRR